MMRLLLVISVAIVLTVSVPASPSAKVYRWIDSDGVVNLSNSLPRRPGDVAPAPSVAGKPPDLAAEASTDPNAEAELAPGQLEDGGLGSDKVLTPAQEVMRLSGLDAQVDILAAVVQQDFAAVLSHARQSEVARYAVAQAFNRDSLRRSAREVLTRELDPKRTPVLLEWLRSPPSRRIVALESELPTPQRLMGKAGFINRLPGAPPSRARLDLAHRLDQVGEVTDTSAAVIQGMREAVMRTVSVLAAASGIPPSGEGDQPSDLPAEEEALKFQTVTSLLFTYQDMSEADLGRYLHFLDSPTGRWFTGLFRRALVESLRVAREEVVAGMRKR